MFKVLGAVRSEIKTVEACNGATRTMTVDRFGVILDKASSRALALMSVVMADVCVAVLCNVVTSGFGNEKLASTVDSDSIEEMPAIAVVSIAGVTLLTASIIAAVLMFVVIFDVRAALVSSEETSGICVVKLGINVDSDNAWVLNLVCVLSAAAVIADVLLMLATISSSENRTDIELEVCSKALKPIATVKSDVNEDSAATLEASLIAVVKSVVCVDTASSVAAALTCVVMLDVKLELASNEETSVICTVISDV